MSADLSSNPDFAANLLVTLGTSLCLPQPHFSHLFNKEAGLDNQNLSNSG